MLTPRRLGTGGAATGGVSTGGSGTGGGGVGGVARGGAAAGGNSSGGASSSVGFLYIYMLRSYSLMMTDWTCRVSLKGFEMC